MIKHKETKPDIVQQLTDLVNQYNYTRELSTNLMRNFNEIDPQLTENEAYGVAVREPHTLHNKNQKPLWKLRQEFFLGSKNL